MGLPFDPDWAHKWRWRAYRRGVQTYLRLTRRGILQRLAVWIASRHMILNNPYRKDGPMAMTVPANKVLTACADSTGSEQNAGFHRHGETVRNGETL